MHAGDRKKITIIVVIIIIIYRAALVDAHYSATEEAKDSAFEVQMSVQ